MAAGIAFRIPGATTVSQVESSCDYYLLNLSDIAYEALPPCEHCKYNTKYVGCPPCQKCGGTGKDRESYINWLDNYPEGK